MFKHTFTGSVKTPLDEEEFKKVFKEWLEDDEEGTFEITATEEVPDEEEEEEDDDGEDATAVDETP